jgi:voltage-gated sodium channel
MSFIISVAQKITKDKIFNIVIFSVILLSAIIIGLETYSVIAADYRSLLNTLDVIIVAIFSVEIGLKILAFGRKPWKYFAEGWNVFDFIIVAVCLIPVVDTHFFAVFRILRVLRILRMITFFPKLRLLIAALLKSIPSMGYVILLIAVLFYVYAIVGVFIFGNSDPMHFGDLHHTLVTLFKILTLEGWTDIMNVKIFGPVENGKEQIIVMWPFFYFASFILIGAMIIMNLFIGVIMNSMQESEKEMTQEFQKSRYKNKSYEELYMHLISKLDELRDEIKNLKE